MFPFLHLIAFVSVGVLTWWVAVQLIDGRLSVRQGLLALALYAVLFAVLRIGFFS